MWVDGLARVHRDREVLRCLDFSATPIYGTGSGHQPGALFEWVVSDFALVDAIESGLVKIPRIPTDDNAVASVPKYRNLWEHVKRSLPRGERDDPDRGSDLTAYLSQVDGPLKQLAGEWAETIERWRDAERPVPPAMIVVCADTAMAEVLERHIGDKGEAGPELQSSPTAQRTVRIDSKLLASAEARDDAETASDAAERIRRVVSTVGQTGKPGADVRCLISVAMLAEGWDARNVTQILGLRAFTSQLLCEQVVGRGLRRRSYDVGDDGLFEPEYAEVFGVPFAFIPSAGAAKDPKPRRAPVAVRALPERADARIVFPRLIGYRLEMPDPELSADFTGSECRLRLTTDIVPTETHVGDITGYTELVFPEHLRDMREQEVAYRLAHRLLEREFRDELDNPRPWLYPKVLRVVKRWIDEAVDYDGGTYPGLLLLHDVTERAVEKIKHAIVAEDEREDRLLPVFDTPQDGSTDWVDFTTSRPAEPTDPGHCPVSHVVVDSGWELTVAKVLEELPGVAAYVKNDHLGFDVPYTYEGRAARYWPDFLVRLTDAGDKIVRTLIVEVSGGATKHHSPGPVAEKADTTRHLWVPAVNRHGGWGLWGYVEIRDPSAAASGIAEAMADLRSAEHIDPRTTPTSGTLV